jgi:16S rRNA (cytosine967-C5)-methyltransferase
LSRHYSHIKSAINFIENVKTTEPLVHQLKRFFASNKKYGSKDRKNIAAFCYSYFRIGLSMQTKSIEEKIIASIFLCNQTSNETLAHIAPQLDAKIKISIEKKLLELDIKKEDIFPYENYLGEGIDTEKFAYSFLKQPLLFIRTRPTKNEEVLEKLSNENNFFEEITTSCIALPAATKIDELFVINKDVVVQDKNSQQVFNYLQKPEVFLPKEPVVWDCCAASGGKSILLYDLLHGHVDLHVSDVRASILNNLRNRFKEAGIKKYESFVADILDNRTNLPEKKYDIIVCDAPCTGSGTWARTPEQLSFFEEKSIYEYSGKQQKIAARVLPYLKKEGLFFYITCSVFKQENEDVVTFLQEKFHLQVMQMEYLKGYETQADTMFVAVLTF